MVPNSPSPIKTCSVDGCERETRSNGLCGMHYQRVRKYGTPGEVATRKMPHFEHCQAQGCNLTITAKGYCSKHWQRFHKHGDPSVVKKAIPPPPINPWDRIDASGGPDACWPWTHSLTPEGYGVQKIQGKVWPAHRWVLAQKVGDLRPEEVTRHTCDNPPCCNPAHLLRGTPADNTQDMVSRNRQIRGDEHWTAKDATKVQGESNGEAKLTNAEVLKIRSLYAAGGWTQKQLGHRYGVTQTTISGITRGRLWKHLLAA